MKENSFHVIILIGIQIDKYKWTAESNHGASILNVTTIDFTFASSSLYSFVHLN